MLIFQEQYNILSGVYYAFSNNSKEKLLYVSHSNSKIEKMSKLYNSAKYNTWTKQNFILLNLYINLTQNISSHFDVIQVLNNISKEDIEAVFKFKKSIVHYKREIIKDVNLINETYGGKLKYASILKLFREGKIQWFTLWYYVQVHLNKDKLLASRRYKKLLQKIEVLHLYININEDVITNVLSTVQDNLLEG